MGLDLSVTLTGLDGVDKFKKYENNEFSIEAEDTVSLYYRLNWYGVGMESQFFAAKLKFSNLSLEEISKMRISKSKIKRNLKSIYLVRGISYNYKGQPYTFEKLVRGKYLSRDKKNFVKINTGYKQKTKVYKYKIYELNIKDLYFTSLLTIISLGKWHGGNSEFFSLQKENNEIFVNEAEQNAEGNWEDFEVLRLSNEDKDSFEKEVYDISSALDIYLEKHPDDYIANKSRILNDMLKEVIENPGVILNSSFC